MQTTLVGTLGKYRNNYFVIPDNKKIPSAISIHAKGLNGARKGQQVLVEITGHGGKGNDFRLSGKVLEVIGYAGEPGVDIMSIVLSHGFPAKFPDAAMLEAGCVPEKVDARRLRGRRDLRGARLFTIDGEDSKDLDDAVSIEPLMPPAAYRLGVHIADVAAYVAQGSALDHEALRRGTSLYFADRVIPMLPQNLSNGICSLHPHADRLALSVYMDIDADGNVLSHEIFESVVNSSYRMTYENVRMILEERDMPLRAEYAEILGDLELMGGLARILVEKRRKRGALDISAREAKLELDGGGVPISVEARKMSFANQLIEEFMILCNETVAGHMQETGLPFIYRTHEKPDREKIASFIELAHSLGLTRIKPDRHSPTAGADSADLQEILGNARDSGYEKLISYLLLRSLAKAGYTPDNPGHFGLASDCYCHFTSPIRRYPDLLIHRIIKAHLKHGGLTKAAIAAYKCSLCGICESCSERERAADETERDIEALKKAEYMRQFVGDVFQGVVSGVTSFGMFVELENTVEGLVRVGDMRDDYYEFDARHYSLTGENSGKSYRIGDTVDVVLVRANTESRQIDFMLHKGAASGHTRQASGHTRQASEHTRQAGRHTRQAGRRAKKHG